MSYSDILIGLARQSADSPFEMRESTLILQPDQVMFGEILSEIPNKRVLLTQILFALDQIQELVRLVSGHHEGTGLHLGRVGHLGALLAKKAKLHWRDRLECLYGGWVHDVGKIYISDLLLDKPGKLTNEEYDLIKMHVRFGCEILSFYPHLGPFMAPVRFHHERFDGRGYPNGLFGEDIPLCGRLTAIVDAYDAMTSSRPYSFRKTHAEAIAEIEKCLGSHFDAKLGEIFCEIPEREISAISQRDHLITRIN